MNSASADMIAAIAQIGTVLKNTAGPKVVPRRNANMNEYVYDNDIVEPDTYSPAEIGSQLIRSVDIDWIGWLISLRIPNKIMLNVRIDGIPESASVSTC